jgi:hypothetical protein
MQPTLRQSGCVDKNSALIVSGHELKFRNAFQTNEILRFFHGLPNFVHIIIVLLPMHQSAKTTFHSLFYNKFEPNMGLRLKITSGVEITLIPVIKYLIE